SPPAPLVPGRGSPAAFGDVADIHAASAHRRNVAAEVVALHDEIAKAAAALGELDQAAPGVSARVLVAVADRDQLEVVLIVEGDGIVRALPGMVAAGLHAESQPHVRIDAPVQLRDRDHCVVDAGKSHDYSGLIPARSTTLRMRFRPSWVHFVTVSGGEPIGSRPCAISFSRTSGEAIALTRSAFRRSTI